MGGVDGSAPGEESTAVGEGASAEKPAVGFVRHAALIVKTVGGDGWGVTYVPATVSGALVQHWAGAAAGKVSPVDKVMLTARARTVKIDRLGIIILAAGSGGDDQGGHIRHDERGKGRSFVKLLLVFVIWTVKLDMCQVHSLSKQIQFSLWVVLCPFQTSFQVHVRMRFSTHILDCLGRRM